MARGNDRLNKVKAGAGATGKESTMSTAEMYAKQLEDENSIENVAKVEQEIEKNNDTENDTEEDAQVEDAEKKEFEQVRSILDDIFSTVEEKESKERANLYLKQSTMIKLKTLAYKQEISLNAVLEQIVEKVVENVEGDAKLAKKYDASTSKRGRKKSN